MKKLHATDAKLWCDRYTAHPFEDVITQLTLSEGADEGTQTCTEFQLELEELEATIERQSTFYYQVSFMDVRM